MERDEAAELHEGSRPSTEGVQSLSRARFASGRERPRTGMLLCPVCAYECRFWRFERFWRFWNQ